MKAYKIFVDGLYIGTEDFTPAAEKALKSKRRGYTSDRKRAAAELTLDIFRRLCK